ncbi:MAG: hypothetical protein Q9208_007399 [Pyrenodesmia sp. 3 TL-2023]
METDEQMAKRLEKCFLDGTMQAVCGCSECLEQYPVNFVGHLRGNEAFQLATTYTNSIFANSNNLRAVIWTFGHIILKRWRRRNSTKRRDLLMEVDPDLYPKNVPLMDLATRLIGESIEEQSKYRYAYLLPYLNLEGLSSESANLLGLLHHRISSQPEEWVIFDNSIIKSAWDQNALRVNFADGCITMHGSHFGTWKPFDITKNIPEMHSGKVYSASRALLILEAQAHLLEFLRKLCQAILGDSEDPIPPGGPSLDQSGSMQPNVVGPASPYCSKWTKFVGSGSQQSKDNLWVSYSSLYSSQPFGNPPSFDIDLITEIAENQKSEAQDELWLMQTDCAYFHERARYHEAQWKQDYTPMRPLSQREKYSNISYLSTIRLLTRARDWQWLAEECHHVQQLLCEPGTIVDWGQTLPNHYVWALVGIQALLDKNRKYYKENLIRCMINAETFKSVFKLTRHSDPSEEGWAFAFNINDYPTLYKRDRTAWCLYQLGRDESESRSFPHDQVLQHLDEHLSRNGRKESDRIDQDMDVWISDLAAVERMLTILQYHRPKYLTPGMKPDQATCQQMGSKAWDSFYAIDQVPYSLSSTKLGLDLALYPLEQFRMPKGRKDETWIAGRDRANQALRTLWAKARQGYQTLFLALGVSQECIDPQLEQMKQCESPEHLLQLEVERQQILGRLHEAKVCSAAVLATSAVDLSSPFPASANSGPAKYTPEPIKEKPKTRPQEAIPATASPPSTLGAVEKPPPILYLLKRNSIVYCIVTYLFPAPHDDPSKGCLDWLDFVAAMAAFGFRAENRGGSVFTFKGMIKLPERPLEVQSRSINFHMPHPSTEMSAVILQGMGKRLGRRYAWQRENFRVEEVGLLFGRG